VDLSKELDIFGLVC